MATDIVATCRIVCDFELGEDAWVVLPVELVASDVDVLKLQLVCGLLAVLHAIAKGRVLGPLDPPENHALIESTERVVVVPILGVGLRFCASSIRMDSQSSIPANRE